jgi:beta-lactamase superfamily II metal-dependent hydrolase
LYEIDFLPVENEEQDGGKSGDAIAMRFTVETESREAVVIVDGGFTGVGDDLVKHIRNYYETNDVDLVISTHPDADHLNGLTTVIEEMDVEELLVHQPRLHVSDLSGFSNLEALDELLEAASSNGVRVTEPFTGTTRFDGQLLVLGPTEDFYEQLLGEHLSPQAKIMTALREAFAKRPIQRLRMLAERVLEALPGETLTDEGETSPRNNSSVVTLVSADSRRFMLTGDAGIAALERAADYYEQHYGPFSINPLWFFQAPHHGSKRNVGPTILNRILGQQNATHAESYISYISSAKAAIKHPSPKVVNALARRACEVSATEGRSVRHHHNGPPRLGWTPLEPLPPLAEDDDED